MLHIGVPVVISYDDNCIVQRICMDSTLDGLKKQDWSIEMSYTEEFKHFVIETNSDLLVAFY